MKDARLLFCLLFSLSFLLACQTEPTSQKQALVLQRGAVARSLSGQPLYPLDESPEVHQVKLKELETARANYLADSLNLENILWYARRLGYLYQYPEAIRVYSYGMQVHPEAAEIYRHRGHRYLSTRQFDEAIQDLERAAIYLQGAPIIVEPDGIPNKLNKPLSTLQFNVWYHNGLAYYLKHDFENAARQFETCLNFCKNPDLLVANCDWLYMTYRRLGEKDKAQKLLRRIKEDMEIVENEAYHKRLLMYKGLIEPEELLDLSNTDEAHQLDIVTQGYGVGNWYLYNNRPDKAREIFEAILKTNYWPAFGYIAAEAELYPYQ